MEHRARREHGRFATSRRPMSATACSVTPVDPFARAVAAKAGADAGGGGGGHRELRRRVQRRVVRVRGHRGGLCAVRRRSGSGRHRPRPGADKLALRGALAARGTRNEKRASPGDGVVGAVLRETRAALGARRVRGGLPGHRIGARGRLAAETRPMKRALNVALPRARVPRGDVRGSSPAAAAGDVREPPGRARRVRGQTTGGASTATRSVDPTVLECGDVSGARLSETRPRGRDARRPARRGVVHRRDGGWRKPSPNALVALRCAETWTSLAAAHVRDEDGEDGRVASSAWTRCFATSPRRSPRFLERTLGRPAAAPRRLRWRTTTSATAVARVRRACGERERERTGSFRSRAARSARSSPAARCRAASRRNALVRFCTTTRAANGLALRRHVRTTIRVAVRPEARFLENRRARAAFARRAAAAAHESLGSRDDVPNSVPNETGPAALVRYVRVNVRFLKSRSASPPARRFLASARPADLGHRIGRAAVAAERRVAGRERVSKQRVSRVRESVREFRRGHGGVLQGHRAGVRNGEARVRLYLSAACAASLRGDEAADARRRPRRSFATPSSTWRIKNASGSASDASAAETAARCAAGSRRSSTVGRRLGLARGSGAIRPGAEMETGPARQFSRREPRRRARRRARAARGGHEREGVFVTALRALLETAHACLQTAVDVSETVDATRAASDGRARRRSRTRAAECVSQPPPPPPRCATWRRRWRGARGRRRGRSGRTRGGGREDGGEVLRRGFGSRTDFGRLGERWSRYGSMKGNSPRRAKRSFSALLARRSRFLLRPGP